MFLFKRDLSLIDRVPKISSEGTSDSGESLGEAISALVWYVDVLYKNLFIMW